MKKPLQIWYRTVQTLYKGCLYFIPTHTPEKIGGINKIPAKLSEAKINNVMLITDKGIRNLGLTEHLEEMLSANNIGVIVFDEMFSNPTIKNVEDAKTKYLANGCKAIIAFGGGSVIDCAKTVAARIARPGLKTAQMKGLLKIIKRGPDVFAIPTTAGTGSETTEAAVITDQDTQNKYVISDPALIPKYAVLEPAVTFGLPKGLTATTGMDAMTHAVEAYIGNYTVPETRKAAIEAVRLIFENLEKTYGDGENRIFRANMLQAAFLAGRAFSGSYIGYVHAIAHSLGGKYGTPHGLVSAVVLPVVLERYGAAAYKKLASLARETGLVATDLTDEEAAKVFINKIRIMNKNMGIPEVLEGIKKEDIIELSKRADKEANPEYPAPVLWDAEDFQKVYEAVMQA